MHSQFVVSVGVRISVGVCVGFIKIFNLAFTQVTC